MLQRFLVAFFACLTFCTCGSFAFAEVTPNTDNRQVTENPAEVAKSQIVASQNIQANSSGIQNEQKNEKKGKSSAVSDKDKAKHKDNKGQTNKESTASANFQVQNSVQEKKKVSEQKEIQAISPNVDTDEPQPEESAESSAVIKLPEISEPREEDMVVDSNAQSIEHNKKVLKGTLAWLLIGAGCVIIVWVISKNRDIRVDSSQKQNISGNKKEK